MDIGIALPVKKSIALEVINDDDLLEELASLEHEQWMDFAMRISPEIDSAHAEAWKKLYIPYEDLPENEKEKDRIFARRVLDILREKNVNKSLSRNVSSNKVYNYLRKNYPADVLDWVKDEVWELRRIPLSKVKMARRPGGRDLPKVKRIAESVRNGEKMDPVVLVQTKDGYKIADGYHRTLAFQHAGKKHVYAYVAEGEHEDGPWDTTMHERKLNKSINTYTPAPNIVWSILKQAGYSFSVRDNKATLPNGCTVEVNKGKVKIDGNGANKIFQLLRTKMEQKQTSEDWVDGHMTIGHDTAIKPW